VHTRWLWLLGALSAWACSPARRAVDTQCAFNDDCAEGLVCFARYCRTTCRTDRDCTTANYRCVPSDDPTKSVCVPPTSPGFCRYTSQCPERTVCSPLGACEAQCRSDRDCRFGDYCGTCGDAGLCSYHPALTDGGAPEVGLCTADGG
jgi:hypothetical protein